MCLLRGTKEVSKLFLHLITNTVYDTNHDNCPTERNISKTRLYLISLLVSTIFGSQCSLHIPFKLLLWHVHTPRRLDLNFPLRESSISGKPLNSLLILIQSVSDPFLSRFLYFVVVKYGSPVQKFTKKVSKVYKRFFIYIHYFIYWFFTPHLRSKYHRIFYFTWKTNF